MPDYGVPIVREFWNKQKYIICCNFEHKNDDGKNKTMWLNSKPETPEPLVQLSGLMV